MTISQVFDGSDKFWGVIRVNHLNIILWANEMVQTVNTTLSIFGLTWIDKSVLGVQIFENQCNLLPPETLFYIFLDDDMISNDMVTKHFCLNALLAPLVPGMGCHHSSTLTNSAKGVLGEMRELVFCTGRFGNEILRLFAPGILMAHVITDKFIKLLFIFICISRQARP